VAGLRDLKRTRTREAIQREGLRLIAERGYDSTTCEQIAAAAEVSPATLYRYFAAKEDIVLQDLYDPMIGESVRGRPAREGFVLAVRRGIAQTMATVYQADLEEIRLRTALVLTVPALRARSHEQQVALADEIAAALSDRSGRAISDLTIQVAAASCAAALAVAVQEWARDGGSLPDIVDAALSALGEVGRAR
jgi:AcrR family transcriptional regulator